MLAISEAAIHTVYAIRQKKYVKQLLAGYYSNDSNKHWGLRFVHNAISTRTRYFKVTWRTDIVFISYWGA